VSLAGGPVALSVTQVAGPDAPRLSVLLADRRIDQRAEALARETVNRLLGLNVDLSPFAAMAAPDPLLGPLAADRGKALSDGPDGPRAFPDPEDLASVQPDDLRRHGFSSTKSRTIIAIAQAVVAGELDLEALPRLEREAQRAAAGQR
jgi:3-methyladenine DNA glycosylase/8-oxoguanine DNA glycosylase